MQQTNNPYMNCKGNIGVANANQIHNRSYRNTLLSQPQSPEKIQLKLPVWKSQFQAGRPGYYQGPWYLCRDVTNVAHGNIIAFQKGEIMEELARQVS